MLVSGSFEGSSEIGAYTLLTNDYCIVGTSRSTLLLSTLQACLDIPVVQTTINAIPTIGSMCCGNKNGLLVPYTTTDNELQHLKNSINVKIKRIDERLNALGNVVLNNDRIAVVHNELSAECIADIENILGVEVIKLSFGDEGLVGTFGRLNNVGLYCRSMSEEECVEISELLEVQVLCGTVNKGDSKIGGGLVVNDYVGFCGNKTTVVEKSAIECVFKLKPTDSVVQKALIEAQTQ